MELELSIGGIRFFEFFFREDTAPNQISVFSIISVIQVRFRGPDIFSPYICKVRSGPPRRSPESVPENLSYSLLKMENGVPNSKNRSREKPLSCEKKRNRKRPHLVWEQAALASNGFYARNLADVEKKFPKLTPMQGRVCAFVKAGLPSWRIAEMLGLSERTIENHRHNAHVAIGCDAFERLEEALR